MNVNELLALVQQAVNDGHGEWPVKFMDLELGVPFASDIQFLQGHHYDGERYWVMSTSEPEPPAWARGDLIEPLIVCPICGGSGSKCRMCGGTGKTEPY